MTPDRVVEVVKDDPTDNRILECAVVSGSAFLVTGDRHLLKLGQFEATVIVTPAGFLEIAAKTE